MTSQEYSQMQLSVAQCNIKFYFVTKSGTSDDASKDLVYSYEVIAEFSSSTEHLEWISEDNCIALPESEITKQNVFVLDHFEGPVFEHLSSTKAIVLGPRCVLTCQLTNDVVPNIASPIFTLAMKDVVACVSGIDSAKRSEIHKLVGFMGGLWTKDLTEADTHLITNTITSPKYEKAALRNMKIMKEEWIFEVWRLSQTEDTSFTSEEFYKKYKMPIFHNLVITSTGISEADKNEIVQLINDNGGTYSGSFKSRVTDILISQPNQRNSDKFKAAVKCRKECLMVDWVKDSVSKGYALPFVNYRIYSGQAVSVVLNSTQISNKSVRTGDFNLDNTQLSCIINDFSIAETTLAKTTPMKVASQKHTGYKETLENIDLSLVKQAEGCIDGCIIWLCGFDAKYNDKLKKILNIGGAIRIDEHGPNVEYVIVGKPNALDLGILKSLENANIVTVDWLAASVNMKKMADPKEFAYKLETSASDANQTTVPSPASKKNIEAMNPFRRPNSVPRRLNLNDDNENIENCKEKNLLEIYAQPSNSQQVDSTVDTPDESQEINVFQGLSFAIFGFSEESSIELRGEIEDAGGMTIEEDDFTKIADYLVITGDTYNLNDVNYKYKEIITDLWVQECLNTSKLVNFEYYHRGIFLKKDVKPLEGLNLVFSTYTSSERDYLYFLARALGAEVNDRFIRNENPILICPTADGKKYNGAIKWKRPVVTCEWLKKCLELEEKVPLPHYAVGEAICGEEDEESSTQQNIEGNQNANNNSQTQRFTKNNVADENDIGSQKETNENIVEGIVDRMAEKNMTPAQHPRVSRIKNSESRQASPQSPKTPPGLYASQSFGQTTETTISPTSKFVEDLSPVTRKIVYDICKSNEEKMTPLTKRRCLEEITDSPPDMTVLDPPDIFEIIDRKFVEMPKERPSTPFKEYRKRMYREMLGDKYDGTTTPVRRPPVEDAEIDKERDKTNSTPSTQVTHFFETIKKVRDNPQPSPQHVVNEETQNRETQSMPIWSQAVDTERHETNDGVCGVGWREPDDFFQSRSSFKGTMCFSMSLSIDVEPEKLKDQILHLKGTVCEEQSAFDPSCTHLICSKPNQSEKTLSIIASGRWLLCPAYIEDSFKAGYFLNEELYEWGNPKAEPKLPVNHDVKSNKVAMVGHKWRKELQLRSKQENKPVGIFSGFRVILHAHRKDSFKRLLEAGCGVVVDIKEPYCEQKEIQGVTHCFVDKRIKAMSDADKIGLKKAGIHCVNLMYLQTCLLEDTLPSVEDYAVF